MSGFAFRYDEPAGALEGHGSGFLRHHHHHHHHHYYYFYHITDAHVTGARDVLSIFLVGVSLEYVVVVLR